MKKYFEKIHDHMQNICVLLQNCGISSCYFYIAWKVFKNQNLSHKYEYKFHECIKLKLRADFCMDSDYFDSLEKECMEKQDVNPDELPIWFFWWQGIEEAPDMVKICFKQAAKMSGSHPLILIDQDNYSQYVDMPDLFIRHVEKKHMTITHFSDILRCYLLCQNGGIWIDSTVYVTDMIGSELQQFPLYTIKHGLYSDFHVCKGYWTGFCMMANKPNMLLYQYMCKAFLDYWTKYDYLFCYLLIDCFLAIGYENSKQIKNLVDEIPYNNQEVFELSKRMNSKFNPADYCELCSNTRYHKLTYKGAFYDEIAGGGTTYYGFLKQILD